MEIMRSFELRGAGSIPAGDAISTVGCVVVRGSPGTERTVYIDRPHRVVVWNRSFMGR